MIQSPILVTAILPRHEWSAEAASDHVLLDHDARHRRRFTHVTKSGVRILVDQPQAMVLGDGDGLRLEDGRIIRVEAAAEALIEVTTPDPALLLRLAWHIGNRHLPAELGTGRLRLRADHVIAAMLAGLGATVVRIDAPFTPESGAYAETQGHSHAHAHGHHRHDHHHDHPDHDHHHGPAA